MELRVQQLEQTPTVAGGGLAANYHDSFRERPPPRSHAASDLVACQRDSMLRSIRTKVVSCEPKPKEAAHAPKKKKNGASKAARPDLWLLTLEDTCLFPEGGGQPADTGTVGNVRISNVYRTSEGQVRHVASAPLQAGQEVEVVVDWERRLDHMQHHSAQHLISAIALKDFGIKTCSWELGKNTVTVVLAVAPDDAEQISEVELRTNNAIRESRPIVWHEYTREQLASEKNELLRASAKSLPPEVSTVRLIEITGIDMCASPAPLTSVFCSSGKILICTALARGTVLLPLHRNPCCGTHLPSTSMMQMVKFVKAEPLKGNTLLHFVVGNRVFDAIASAQIRDRGLNKLLCCAPEE